MPNPLLLDSELPAFAEIEPRHVADAINQILADNRSELDQILCRKTFTFKTLIEPLEEMADRLEKAWSPISHLNAVVSSDDLRAAYNDVLPLITAYHTEMGQNELLSQAYGQLKDSEEYAGLESAQRKLIDNMLRDFLLSGISLPAKDKAQFARNEQDLARLSSQFRDNVLDATQSYTRLVEDVSELEGLPESTIAMLRQAAEQRNLSGYLITLDFPSYSPVMTYCNNRDLRREVYTAFMTKASEHGPEELDNGDIILQIMALRQDQASLLGYANFAEVSIVAKMARDTDQVMGFLNDLASRCVEVARNEFSDLGEFARGLDSEVHLEAWDVSYYSEKMREEMFELSQEEVRPFFPADQTIAGFFEITGSLYDLKFEQHYDWQVWHPEVRCYNILREGEVIARFYLDLFARSNKRGGAWMADCRSRRIKRDGSLQIPVAFLTCNFSGPVGDDPALLTHTEVVTLFHEFGHGLHHMLTQVDYAGVSGINGVAWDAVELPSQFMENWCWEPEALQVLSEHYNSGEKLPEELLDKMLAAKNFQSAMLMVRQLEFAIFDFRLHLEYDQTGPGNQIQDILDDVRANVAAVPAADFNRFQHGFGHIFGGGYAAGYYSYKWAEVLSADAFGRFREEGIFNRQTGESFLVNVLEKGGSDDAMALFSAFRGREPDTEALLRQEGIPVFER